MRKEHTMNTKLTIVAAALALVAGTAAAGDLVSVPVERSTLTRAEVQAELLRARAAGELPSSADSYGLSWAHVNTGKAPTFTLRTRDEARSEARGAARQARSTDYVGG